jgi:hypothetical protein
MTKPATATRIYTVANATTTRLIRATTQAAAVRHATRTEYRCSVASTEDVVELLSKGVSVEDSGADTDLAEAG